MYELSGEVQENANGKYSVGYGFFWVAHNAMLSYLKTWKRQMRCRIFGGIGGELLIAKFYSSRREVVFSE
jgi:hypothetical protein